MNERLALIDDIVRRSSLARQSGETAAENGQERQPPFYDAGLRQLWLEGYDAKLSAQSKRQALEATRFEPRPRGPRRVDAWVQRVRDMLRRVER